MYRTVLSHKFASKHLNLRIPVRNPKNNALLDTNLQRYSSLVRHFVLRRRVLRDQIWPKIYIMEGIPEAQQPHLKCQELFSLKNPMSDQMMRKMAKSPTSINSASIISLFCGEHFKPFLDEYVKKVLLCGKAPKEQESMKKIERDVKEWYRVFYYGQKLTPLQREMQFFYLREKQKKAMRYSIAKEGKYNAKLQSTWTDQDQRLLQGHANWHATSPNISETGNYPVFQPLLIESRPQPRLLLRTLTSKTLFSPQESEHKPIKADSVINWVTSALFIRLMHYVNCSEYLNLLNLPHDYSIQALTMQMHIWLITNRLKQFKHLEADLVAQGLADLFQREVKKQVSQIQTKKIESLLTTYEQMFKNSRNVMNFHFNHSSASQENRYKHIDALVWSMAYAEKVHRYSDEVYLFSQYLVQNYYHMQRHTMQDFFDAIVEFDLFLIDPRYKEKIQAINPPLDADEFERQFNSNKKVKDYYYAKVMNEAVRKEEFQLLGGVDHSFKWSQLFQPLWKLMKKYRNLRTIDHFIRMEAGEKKMEEQKNSIWKGQAEKLTAISQEIEKFEKIKRKRMSQNSNFK